MPEEGISWLAAVAEHAGAGFVLRPVDAGTLKRNEVLVSVGATGLCHTDLLWSAGGLPAQPYGFPVVLGHETSGTIVETGADVSELEVGDNVVVALTHHCGRCRQCETGHPMLCTRRIPAPPRFSSAGEPILQGFGVAGFGEAVVVPASSVVRMPADIPVSLGAVIGCAIATGLGAVLNIAHVDAGSEVLVLGAGAVGAAVIAGARLAGAASVCVVEDNAFRRQLAESLGAESSFGSLRELGDSHGDRQFDFTFDAIGASETIVESVNRCAPGGACTLIGIPPKDAEIRLPWFDLIAGQKRLLGCLTGDVRPHQDIPRYLELYRRGLLPLEKFVGKTMTLDQINEACELAPGFSGLRIVITPKSEDGLAAHP